MLVNTARRELDPMIISLQTSKNVRLVVQLATRYTTLVRPGPLFDTVPEPPLFVSVVNPLTWTALPIYGRQTCKALAISYHAIQAGRPSYTIYIEPMDCWMMEH